MMRFALHAVMVAGLTILTQLGGLAWLLAVWALRRFRRGPRFDAPRAAGIALFAAVFAGSYGVLHLAAIPASRLAGRVPLPCLWNNDNLGPMAANGIFCALNRQFAEPQVLAVLDDLTARLAKTYPREPRPQVLDANFPFLDGFPMLPHLSHADGRKVDLAFFWRGRLPSPLGYWGFAEPRPGDPRPCAGRDDWLTGRWDMGWFQAFVTPRELDEKRTARMIRLLVADPRVTKILLEPHLIERLGVAHPKVRFQGCRAARHDDHIHVEVAG